MWTSTSPQYSQRICRQGPQGGVSRFESATTAIDVEVVEALGDRLEDGHPLGAHREAVGRVLDVAAGHDLARPRLERRPHLEAGVGGVGALPGLAGEGRHGREHRAGRARPSSPRVSARAGRFFFMRSLAASVTMRASTSRRRRLHALAGLQDLPVVELAVRDARRHVREAGEAGHPDPHVAGRDHLGHGGHAHRVGAQRPEHADLGRRLVGRPGQRDVDAAVAAHGGRAAGRLRHVAQAPVVGLAHVGEARPEGLLVRPEERVAEQVQVVLDDHQVAGGEGGVDGAGRVRDHERLRRRGGRAPGPGRRPASRE